MSKIFGDFENAADLNECARNLLDNNELSDLSTLAEENDIPYDALKSFISGETKEFLAAEIISPPLSESIAEAVEGKAEEKPEEAAIPPDETAPERLQREVKDAKNRHVPMVPIANRLTAFCETDAGLCVQILLPHKSLDKCFSYVEEQVRKKIDVGRGWIDDDEVYKMAVDYYSLDDAEAERIKEEERIKREEEAKKRAAERQEAAKNNPAAANAASLPPKPIPKNAPTPDQMTLWG